MRPVKLLRFQIHSNEVLHGAAFVRKEGRKIGKEGERMDSPNLTGFTQQTFTFCFTQILLGVQRLSKMVIRMGWLRNLVTPASPNILP